MLLAIDTSAGTSVAVVDAGRIRSEHAVEDTRRHAEVIGTLIVRSLSDAGITTAELSGVAVGMGPGPFTGLRVGIAAAQAFALGASLPVLRIPSHDALAFDHLSAGRGDAVLVTTDARRQERYWSAYRRQDGTVIPQRVAGPGIARSDTIESVVTDYASYQQWDAEWLSAASLGVLAELMQHHGSDFAGPEPLYLRAPDVTVPATQKRVTT